MSLTSGQISGQILNPLTAMRTFGSTKNDLQKIFFGKVIKSAIELIFSTSIDRKKTLSDAKNRLHLSSIELLLQLFKKATFPISHFCIFAFAL